MSAYQVTILRTLSDVEGFLPEWHRFLETEAGDHDVYHTPPYLYRTLYGNPDCKPFIVVV